MTGRRFDLTFCHDAFYFLEPEYAILAAIRELAGDGGRVALSHIHNAEAENPSAGHAVSPAEIARFFPDAAVYDDSELTRAVVEDRAPLAELGRVEAFAIEDRPAGPARAVSGGLVLPPPSASLRLNPLYVRGGDGLSVVWPSSRYQAEYAARATYPVRLSEESARDAGP